MSVKLRKARYTRNRFNRMVYTKITLAVVLLVMFIYVKWFSTYSIRTSGIVRLVVIASVIVAVSWGLSIRYNRNVLSIVCAALIPVLLFDLTLIWPYEDTLKKIDMIALAIIVVISAVGEYCIWRFVIRANIAYHVERVMVMTRIGCCLLLFVSVILGKVYIHKQEALWFSQIMYMLSDTKNDVYDYENCLDANIEEVSKLDPRGGWKELSLEEKGKVLETCVRIGTRYYGLESAPALEIALLENENLLGFYDPEAEKITLSYKYIVDTNADGYACLQVLQHELYHVYQQRLVGLLNDIRSDENLKKYEHLLLLWDAEVYENDMQDYISGDEGVAYLLYSNQQLEIDADSNAISSVVEYYNRIQNYFSKGGV